MNNTENQQLIKTGIAEHLPQKLRNDSAIAFRNSDDNYTEYIELSSRPPAPDTWQPAPVPADIQVGNFILGVALPVVVATAAMAGAVAIIAYALAIVKFWAIAIGAFVTLMYYINEVPKPKRRTYERDRQQTSQTGHNTSGHNIFINHSGNGDVNVNL